MTDLSLVIASILQRVSVDFVLCAVQSTYDASADSYFLIERVRVDYPNQTRTRRLRHEPRAESTESWHLLVLCSDAGWPSCWIRGTRYEEKGTAALADLADLATGACVHSLS